MYYLNYLLDLENNLLIAGILLGATAVLCIGIAVLSFLVKKPIIDLIGAIVSGLLMVVTTLFAHHILTMIAYLLSVASLAYFLAKVCQEYHKKTIYRVPFVRLYFRMFFPIYVVGMLFRPWFSQADTFFYRFFPGLGLNDPGTYVFDVTVINEVATATVWNIISVLEILLFLMIFITQIVLIWREFIDPDNAPTWATFGMIITAIGGMFIYGIYTSPNFHIATYTLIETTEKLNFSTGEFETVTTFTPMPSNLDNLTAAPAFLVLCALVNRLFYMEKRKKEKKA